MEANSRKSSLNIKEVNSGRESRAGIKETSSKGSGKFKERLERRQESEFNLLSSLQIRDNINKMLNYPIAFPKLQTQDAEPLKDIWLHKETPISSGTFMSDDNQRSNSENVFYGSQRDHLYLSGKVTKAKLLSLIKRFVENLKSNAALGTPILSLKQIFMIGDLSTTEKGTENPLSIAVFLIAIVKFLFWSFFLISTPLAPKSLPIILLNVIILGMKIVYHISKNALEGLKIGLLLVSFLVNMGETFQAKYFGLFYLYAWNKLEDPFSLNLNLKPKQRTILQYLKLIFVLILASHHAASFILSIAKIEAEHGGSLYFKITYFKAFNWSFNNLLFRDYHFEPGTPHEMGVAFGIQLILFVLSIYLIVWIASVSVHQFEVWLRHEKSINHLNDYMHKMMISEISQKKIRNFLLSEKDDRSENLQATSSCFSNTILKKLKKEGYKNILSKIPFLSKNFQPAILEKSLDFIEEIHHFPNDIIKFTDSSDISIYYLVAGEAEVYLRKSKKCKIGIYTQGNPIFCQEFVTGERPTTYLRCIKNCTFIRISRQKFLAKLKNIPYQYEKFCYIKDSYNLYFAHKILQTKCASCESLAHSSELCSKLKPNFNKELIYSRINYSKESARNIRYFRSNRQKFGTLKKINRVRKGGMMRMSQEELSEYLTIENENNSEENENQEEDQESNSLCNMPDSRSNLSIVSNPKSVKPKPDEMSNSSEFEKSNLFEKQVNFPSLQSNSTLKAENIPEIKIEGFIQRRFDTPDDHEFLLQFECFKFYENYFVTGNVEEVIYRVKNCPKISNVMRSFFKLKSNLQKKSSEENPLN